MVSNVGERLGASGAWCDASVQWNIEQAQRRALRNLQQRGLVELGRYVFLPEPILTALGTTSIVWRYRPPGDHVPGQSRIMTGVLLTDAGRDAAKQTEG
jgi:hypothetical protein